MIYNFTTRKNLILFSILYFCFATIALVFSPPFFTYDSYHYMYLSLIPKYGDSHSIGFGYFLKFLAVTSDFFYAKSFTTVFLLWNSLCLSVFFFVPCIYFANELFNHKDVFKIKSNRVFWAITLILLITLTSNLLLVNAFWSEMTSLLQLAIFAVSADRYLSNGKKRYLLVLTIICPLAYHTRYLMVLLPACLVGIFVLQFFKCRSTIPIRVSKTRLVFAVSVIAASLAFTNFTLSRSLPNLNIKRDTTALVLNTSMQCALRCHTKMFETDCSTPEGKKIIEGSLCRDIIFGLVKTGNPVADPSSAMNIIKQNGLLNSIIWVLIAPFTYLTDKHDLEVGLFAFGKDTAPATAYPEVINYYGRFFADDTPTTATPSFAPLVRLLHILFHGSFFHLLTIIILAASGYVLLKTKNITTAIMATYALGTYMVFAYLNPHVPFRFLMQIISPGVLATCLYFIERKKLSVKN